MSLPEDIQYRTFVIDFKAAHLHIFLDTTQRQRLKIVPDGIFSRRNSDKSRRRETRQARERGEQATPLGALFHAAKELLRLSRCGEKLGGVATGGGGHCLGLFTGGHLR